MKFKLIDHGGRNHLAEGRSCGFGTNFLKKIDDKTYETAYPLTACKDFLAEVVSSEHTGQEWSIYGIHSTKKNIFDFKRHLAYLGFGILPNNSGGKHSTYEKEYKALQTNWKNIEKFLNWFEKKFKIKGRTKLYEFDTENRYLAVLPIWWTTGTYKIGLYGLLMRMAIFYNGKDDPMEFLNNFKEDSTDVYQYNSVRPKLEKMLAGFIPEQDLNKTGCPHNIGPVSYAFNMEQVKNNLKKTGVLKPSSFLQPATF
jgi:hypothetical protein